MARRKTKPASRVSHNGKSTQENFALDAGDTRRGHTHLEADSAPASTLCRCGKAPKIARGLFCEPCTAEYRKLWTTPPSGNGLAGWPT